LQLCEWHCGNERARKGLPTIPIAVFKYASGDYTALLSQHGIRISMSRKGNPYDNATCESFMKTLKYEEVVCCERLVG
jgi:transposase InsO family protein